MDLSQKKAYVEIVRMCIMNLPIDWGSGSALGRSGTWVGGCVGLKNWAWLLWPGGATCSGVPGPTGGCCGGRAVDDTCDWLGPKYKENTKLTSSRWKYRYFCVTGLLQPVLQPRYYYVLTFAWIWTVRKLLIKLVSHQQRTKAYWN